MPPSCSEHMVFRLQLLRASSIDFASDWTCSVKESSRSVRVPPTVAGRDGERTNGMPARLQPSARALSAEKPSVFCTRTLRKEIRRGRRLSSRELRIFSKFLLSWYWRKAVWILQAARREMRWPPYLSSNISI